MQIAGAPSTEKQERPTQLRPGWQPGQSGNPNGRPKGTLSRAGELARILASRNTGRIMRAVINAAEAGDMVAAKLILDRIWPVPKTDGGVNVTLNQLNLQGMSDIELARRMALMMRALLDQPSQPIDIEQQSDQQPSDADSA